MYRPSNWENPHELEYKPGVNSAVDIVQGEAYEAGADAMLSHLKELIKSKAPYSKLMDILGEG